MIDPIDFHVSEIGELEQMLKNTPASEVIHRLSIQNRLKSVNESLARERASPKSPRAKLTFRARPIIDLCGIAEDSAGNANDVTADALAAVVAGLNGHLQFMGPIPDREKTRLLIAGSAIGSFSFEFEQPPSG